MDLRDAAEFDRWRAQAGRTIETAEMARAGDRPEWACFLAEQAAQLAVKGLLHGVAEQAWGHDLAVLEQACQETPSEVWPSQRDRAVRLSRHYIPARYPDAHPSGPPGAHYTGADAREALEDARTVLAAVDQAWAALAPGAGA